MDAAAAAAPLLGGARGGPSPRRDAWHVRLAVGALLGAAVTAAALAGAGSRHCARAAPWPPARASPAYLALLDAAGPLLPPAIHASLPGSSLPPGSRVLIVGDVHGCSAELAALLARARFRSGTDTLVLAGDLVAKGPDSAGVLDALASTPRAFAVRGNHDDAALAAAEAWTERRVAPPLGLGWVANLTSAHTAALAALPFSLSLPSLGVAVIHAGAVPGVRLDRQRLGDLYTMRGIRQAESGGGWEAVEACGVGRGRPPARPSTHGRPADGTNETCARTGGRALGALPWAPHWAGPPHLVFGHDHVRGLQLAPAATGLDTGAVDGGWLTGLAVCVPPPGGGAAAAESACFADLAGDEDGVSQVVPGFRGGRARLVWVRAAHNYTAEAAGAT